MNPFQRLSRLLAPALLTLPLAATAPAFEPGLDRGPDPRPVETQRAPAPEKSYRDANGDRLRADIADALEHDGRAFRLELSLTPPTLDVPMVR